MQFMYFSVIYMYLGVNLVNMATIVKFYGPSVGSSFECGSLPSCDNFLAIPISDFGCERSISLCTAKYVPLPNKICCQVPKI